MKFILKVKCQSRCQNMYFIVIIQLGSLCSCPGAFLCSCHSMAVQMGCIIFWLDPSYTASLHLKDDASIAGGQHILCIRQISICTILWPFHPDSLLLMSAQFATIEKTDSTIIARCFPLSLCFQDLIITCAFPSLKYLLYPASLHVQWD